MDILIDKSKLVIKIVVTDEDIPAAKRIEKLMADPAWSDIFILFGSFRLAIEDSIKDVLATDADAKKTQVKAAIFKGFDMCADLPMDFIKEVAKLKPQETSDETEQEEI